MERWGWWGLRQVVDHLMHNDDARITLAPRAKDKDKGNCGVNVGTKVTNTYRDENDYLEVEPQRCSEIILIYLLNLGGPPHQQDQPVNSPRSLPRSCHRQRANTPRTS